MKGWKRSKNAQASPQPASYALTSRRGQPDARKGCKSPQMLELAEVNPLSLDVLPTESAFSQTKRPCGLVVDELIGRSGNGRHEHRDVAQRARHGSVPLRASCKVIAAALNTMSIAPPASFGLVVHVTRRPPLFGWFQSKNLGRPT